jgi:glycosyltransferase involved in cell wall biosynthesis
MDLVVVDDGSTDGGGQIAHTKGAVVLRNPEKTGKGASLQRGFHHILQQDYDGVITMDGDGQHDPGDLEQFNREIKSHPQAIVTGNRMANSQGMPFLRLLTNRLMSWLISQICHQSIPDTQCGYRYISRAILERLDLSASKFEIETEVLIKASRLGCLVYSVPIKTIYRNEESKINPIKDTIRFIAYILKELFHRKSKSS